MKDRVKNRNDKRYLRVQVAIDKALQKFIKKGHIANLQIGEVSKEADIYKSTFYDHHHNLDAALKHFNTKMDKELRQIATEVKEANCSLEIVYYKLLFFIYKNKDYYDVMIKYKNMGPFFEVVKVAKPQIKELWKISLSPDPALQKRTFTSMSWDFCEEIWWWGHEENFREQEINSLAKKLVRLTEIKPKLIKMV